MPQTLLKIHLISMVLDTIDILKMASMHSIEMETHKHRLHCTGHLNHEDDKNNYILNHLLYRNIKETKRLQQKSKACFKELIDKLFATFKIYQNN